MAVFAFFLFVLWERLKFMKEMHEELIFMKYFHINNDTAQV